MKPSIKETHIFEIEIPIKKVIKALRDAGYEIPDDAHMTIFSHAQELNARWNREQK